MSILLTIVTQNVTISSMLKEFKTALLDVIYPKSCHICSKILKDGTDSFDDYICRDCFLEMKKTSVSYELVRSSTGSAAGHHKLISYFIYEGSIKKLIHKFKYGNRPYLSKTIAALISACLKEHDLPLLSNADYLVPVPLHAVRQREREFNQSELIARELSREFIKPVCLAVKRDRFTKPQSSLNETERRSNVKGAFSLSQGAAVKDKNILIIDDVITTTATVKEVAGVLKKAGAKSLSILSFARG